MTDPVHFLRNAPLGTRVVVRRRIPHGLSDALGFLRRVTAEDCTVETRDGVKTFPLAAVIAAKEVPPAPPRRRAAARP